MIVENLSVPFDRRVWQEATALKRNGYDITIICPMANGYESKCEVIDGIRIYRHPLPVEARRRNMYVVEYSAALFWEFILAWRVFLRHDFDVIHACNPPDTIFLVGAFFKFFLGKKFLFDHHDLNPDLYLAKFNRQDIFYRLLLKFERWTYRISDVSIATNESYRRIAISRGGMPSDRVFVVRSGPDLDRMRVLPPVISLKHGRRYLVGYVGVMGLQEGIHFLLKAARYIVQDRGRDDVHFGLVGAGPELEAMKRLATELDISDFVTFYGRLPDKDLLEVLNTADICVNPDEYNAFNDQSTMNKIMEYMALGKPIVQFDLAEGRASAQQASLYAKPNDSIDLAEKMIELLDNPSRRAEMGEFGRERVLKKLAWQHEVPKLLAAYGKLWN